jgi:hypothetical protein
MNINTHGLAGGSSESRRTTKRWLLAAAIIACSGLPALAQSTPSAPPAKEDAPAPSESAAKKKPLAPADEPVPPALADQEKLLRKVRFKYLGSIRKVEIRQIGLAKLREFTDPLIFPKMLEVFKRDKADVRDALLDHFADTKSDEGDATLGWCAVFSEDEEMRDAATKRLVKRVEECRRVGKAARAAAATAPSASTPVTPAPASGGAAGPSPANGASTKPSSNILVDPDVSWRVKKIISNGMLQSSDEVAGAAAQLAENLNLVEAIPQMINLQVQTPGGNSVALGERGGGALAFIQVGTQQAFVSDLTPVVGDSAVAFDPTISVLTEGTVLRIDDAVVTTYRTIIHYPLTRLANANWDGRSTASMKFDNKKWSEWFTKEFMPYREKVAAGLVPELPSTAKPKK